MKKPQPPKKAVKNGKTKHRLKPLSLHPLKAEEALRLFMQVDPGKVRVGIAAMRRKKVRAPS